MNKAPAFQFFARDWLDFRVQRMSFAAQGAYMKLLCFMWMDSRDQCSVIDNNDFIARAMGTTVEEWLRFRTEIQCDADPILEEKNGLLVSARLRHEAAGQRKRRKAQSENGKRSAQRRLNDGSTTVQPSRQPMGNSSSSSSRDKEKIAVSASPSPAVSTSRMIKLADEEFIAELKRNPAYRGLDIDREIGKIQAWLLTPKGKGKHLTQRRLVNWLNSADIPMTSQVQPPSRPLQVVL